jgi:hypothetical protein
LLTVSSWPSKKLPDAALWANQAQRVDPVFETIREGPYSGGKHQFMVKDDITVRLPNPHQGDIGQEFLARILRQARIDREQWEIL